MPIFSIFLLMMSESRPMEFALTLAISSKLPRGYMRIQHLQLSLVLEQLRRLRRFRCSEGHRQLALSLPLGDCWLDFEVEISFLMLGERKRTWGYPDFSIQPAQNSRAFIRGERLCYVKAHCGDLQRNLWDSFFHPSSPQCTLSCWI